MVFNSYIFWGFFVVVVVLCRCLDHRGQNRALLVASYVFYGYWSWKFLFLLAGSTVVDFLVAPKVARARTQGERRRWLCVSLAANLGALGFFKYFGFFVDEFVQAAAALGFAVSPVTLHIVLPVGISFYTFQTLSYTIDVYRGKREPVKRFDDFALYVAFFPQLVAGPIERSQRLIPQITQPRVVRGNDFSEGLYLVLSGLFKKVVIADNMAVIVDTVFSTPASSLSAPEVLVGVYAFAFQIYGDFSGYSSIAQGVSRWLGFNLMDNFRHPYFATSPQDFWRRWHISLSTWLRDYLYISLGGNRRGERKTYRNLLATMVLGGLWHGANWTFLIWGAFHGLWLAVHRWFNTARHRGGGGDRAGRRPRVVVTLVKVVATFHLVCFGWLFFRSASAADAVARLKAFSGSWELTHFSQSGFALIAFYALPLLAYEFWVEKRDDLYAVTKIHWVFRAALYFIIAVMLLFFHAPVRAEFIYFQF